MELTPEQKTDSEARIADFRSKYQALVAELQIDFAAFPQFVPGADGKGFVVTAPMVLLDRKYMPVESPFNNNEPVIKS